MSETYSKKFINYIGFLDSRHDFKSCLTYKEKDEVQKNDDLIRVLKNLKIEYQKPFEDSEEHIDKNIKKNVKNENWYNNLKNWGEDEKQLSSTSFEKKTVLGFIEEIENTTQKSTIEKIYDIKKDDFFFTCHDAMFMCPKKKWKKYGNHILLKTCFDVWDSATSQMSKEMIPRTKIAFCYPVEYNNNNIITFNSNIYTKEKLNITFESKDVVFNKNIYKAGLKDINFKNINIKYNNTPIASFNELGFNNDYMGAHKSMFKNILENAKNKIREQAKSVIKKLLHKATLCMNGVKGMKESNTGNTITSISKDNICEIIKNNGHFINKNMKRCKKGTLCHDVLTNTINYVAGMNDKHDMVVDDDEDDDDDIDVDNNDFLYKLLMDLKRTGDWERVNAVLRMQKYIERVWRVYPNENDNEDKRINLFKSYFRSNNGINYKNIKRYTKIILFTRDWLCFLYGIIMNINCTYQENNIDGYNCSYIRVLSHGGGNKKKLQSGGNKTIYNWYKCDEQHRCDKILNFN
jgi:hypothetical protein